MTNDLYAPPRAAVADVIPGPIMARPWQVTLAVRLAWLSLFLPLPAIYDELFVSTSAEASPPMLLGFFLTTYAILIALLIVLFVSMARGYRWARIVYSALVLWGLFEMFRSVPAEFERTWYFGVLHVVENLIGAATLWLLFTGPANAWFRTRGGRYAPP
jgi:hypothetical protein